MEPGPGIWEGNGWLFVEAVAERQRHNFCSLTSPSAEPSSAARCWGLYPHDAPISGREGNKEGIVGDVAASYNCDPLTAQGFTSQVV